MGIASRLQVERKRLGFSQELLASHVGSTKRSVINWEGGAATPSAEVLTGYAAAGADVLFIVTGQRSQALPPEATLPKDEQALLDAYRACAPEARRNLIATAALLGAGMVASAPSTAPAPAPSKVRVSMDNNRAGAVQVGYAGGKVSVSTGGVKKSQKKAC